MTAHAPLRKPVTVNPLKLSQPLGAALAFLGVAGAVPIFHGAKGCASFAMVNLVKHFRESIPFQSTGLDEISAIMGGGDILEQAILNVRERTGARLVGICSTGLTEVRGEDIFGDLRLLRDRHRALGRFPVAAVSTPDFEGNMQDGWAKAVEAIIDSLVVPGGARIARQVNVLAGSHLTPGDVEAIREIVESFGLLPIILPDLAGSLDGHLPDAFEPVALGGADVDQLRTMGRSEFTLALGEQMRPAARLLAERGDVAFRVFERLSGLNPVDEFLLALARISGRPVPERLRRQRRQLQDAMLDGHFYFGGAHIVLAGDPDLVFGHAGWLADLGAEISAVVSGAAPVPTYLPATMVCQGDMEDLEALLPGIDVLMTNAHGARLAEEAGCALYRIGYPVFDRLGPQAATVVGYRGTRDAIFAVGNLLIERRERAPHPLHPYGEPRHDRPPFARH